jgi:hypothetical protein
MVPFELIGGIDYYHWPQLAQPLVNKKKMNLPKGIPSNVKKVLDKGERKLKLYEEQ